MRRQRLLFLLAAAAVPMSAGLPAVAADAPTAAAGVPTAAAGGAARLRVEATRLPAVAARLPGAGAAAATRHALHVGQALRRGDALVSPNGRYRASLLHGRLVVANRAGHWRWASSRTDRHAVLRIGRSGQLKLVDARRNVWTAGTAGSGSDEVLRMRDDGSLALLGRGGLAWSSVWRNTCPDARGQLFVVDVSRQLGRACANGQQLRFTRVTTGATALGDATPLGTWHVQAKVRNTTLYPASGGAYPVKYWMPYDGEYGLHDSPWQTFAYGSPKYRRHGSHGCVHVPGPMMRWLFGWARVGSTTVTIHR